MTAYALPPVTSVPLDLIDPPAFNSRLGFDADGSTGADQDLAGLAKSMKTEGLKQPIEVEKVADRYLLVFGSRRFRAARSLKWDSIPAFVYEPRSAIDRILSNGIENLQRKDLSTFEEARLCAELREHNLPLKECAERLGFSTQKVSNYARAYMLLPAEIRDAWQKGDKAASMEFLIELAGIKGDTDDERLTKIKTAWDERVALQQVADSILLGSEEDEDTSEEDETESDSSTAKRPGGIKAPDYKVKREFYKHIINTLKAKKVAGSSLAAQVLDLAVGKIQAVRGLTSADAFEKATELKKSNK